ncbi:acyl carrier protein [Streptomyces sp. NPDC050095]|uniref:acyl carrier protein n=1 Tax=unclassified Streptomyces TaxID=2593676 RepID=UPI00341B5A07
MTTTPAHQAYTTEESVLAELTDVLGTVLDPDELEFTEVTMDTRFVEDLDLESIDLVTLTGELRRRYGDRVDFPAWFASLDLSEIIGLSVGQVVRYVVGQLR